MNLERACRILKISKNDSMTNIRKKYIKLIQQFHPDVSKEKNALEISQEINFAYEYIKKHLAELKTMNEQTTTSPNNSYTDTFNDSYNKYIYYEYKHMFTESYSELCLRYVNYNLFVRKKLDFKEWIIYELRVNDLCKNFSSHRDGLNKRYTNYCIMTGMENTLENFVIWLETEFKIKKYCEFLSYMGNKKDIYKIFLQEQQPNNKNMDIIRKRFISWLEEKMLQIFTFAKKKYILYCRYLKIDYSDDEFLEWIINKKNTNNKQRK